MSTYPKHTRRLQVMGSFSSGGAGGDGLGRRGGRRNKINKQEFDRQETDPELGA